MTWNVYVLNSAWILKSIPWVFRWSVNQQQTPPPPPTPLPAASFPLPPPSLGWEHDNMKRIQVFHGSRRGALGSERKAGSTVSDVEKQPEAPPQLITVHATLLSFSESVQMARASFPYVAWQGFMFGTIRISLLDMKRVVLISRPREKPWNMQ